MTLTEQTAVSVPPSPASPPPGPNIHSECNLIPRIVSFTDESLLQVPLDTSIVDRLLLLVPSVGGANFGSFANILPSKHNIIVSCTDDVDKSDELLSDENGDTSDQPLEILSGKLKRLLLTLNDMIYERDRFRARFESFNTTNNAVTISEEKQENQDDECEVCGQISTKTKKVNVLGTKMSLALSTLSTSSTSSHLLTVSVLDRLFNYLIKEPVLPLDSSLIFFKNHLSPINKPELPEFPFNVRSITLPQLAVVLKWYFNRPLPPTSHMFPWLHGLHQDNYTQRSFFISQQILQSGRLPAGGVVDFEAAVGTPQSARFIMCVESSDTGGFDKRNEQSKPEEKVLRNTVAMDEILLRIEHSRLEVVARVRQLVAQAFPGTERLDELTSLLAQDCFNTGHVPVLLNLDPDRGVSLRNFHIQVAKLAKCSDFVVYCSGPDHMTKCKCKSVARLLRLAQMSDTSAPDFNVFLLSSKTQDLLHFTELATMRDNTTALSGTEAQKKTQLTLHSMVELSADTFSVWDADYQVKEKVETTRMSAATRLLKNVWLGNIWDHQIMMHYWQAQEGVSEESVDVKIEPEHSGTGLSQNGHIYCDPANSSLTAEPVASHELLLSLLPPPRAHWKLFVHCHNDARFPDAETLADLLFKYTLCSRRAEDVDEIVHLEFPSSGSIGFGDCKQDNLMSIVNTCKLLYLYSSLVADGSLASLIYCSDGYTELSLLLFCFLIYAEDISLEEAMLRLHKDYGRPFYIFNSDVLVLRKLEVLLRKFSPEKVAVTWASPEHTTCQEINDLLLGRSCSVSSTSSSLNAAKGIPKNLRLGYIANDLDSDLDSDTEDEEDLNDTLSFLDRSWVEDVEGLFPSRILPYLYLGLLRHANNLALLTKLGVKKVISVGEELDWLNGHKFQHNHDIIVDEMDHGNIEVFSITPKPTSYNKNNSTCSVESVVKVNNLQDDGIDELTKSLPQILAQIDAEYRKTGGDTKILVHCRVGVLRSATVVIAEVMRRLGLNLPKAYLYVRVRRLNIVIQPNLRFMYELFKWEEQERAKKHETAMREIDWFVMCREIKKLNLPFLQN